MTTFFIALVFVPGALIELLMLYCPRCKSDQIFPVAGGYVGQVYLCKGCGYRGSFILEADPLPEGEEPEKR
jgi:hypothetical protein